MYSVFWVRAYPTRHKMAMFKHVHIYLFWCVHVFEFGLWHVCFMCKYLQLVIILDFRPQDWPMEGRATFCSVQHLCNWYLLSYRHQGFSSMTANENRDKIDSMQNSFSFFIFFGGGISSLHTDLSTKIFIRIQKIKQDL